MELADKPGSVVDNHSSGIYVTVYLKQPTREPCGPHLVPLFGLAPSGVYPATDVATSAVRSYRTISTLPVPYRGGWGHRRYIFCGTFRRLTPPRRYLALCPVEPGLSSRK